MVFFFCQTQLSHVDVLLQPLFCTSLKLGSGDGRLLGSSRSADDDVAAYPQTWLRPLVAAKGVREVAEHCRHCKCVIGIARCMGPPVQHRLHEALAEERRISWSSSGSTISSDESCRLCAHSRAAQGVLE